MSRLGPLPMTAHARWDDGTVALFGWDGRTPASGGWLSGVGGLARSLGGFPASLPTLMASLSRVEVPVPGGAPIIASCLRLDPDHAVAWFARMTFVDDDALSPSLQWFRAMAELAEATVDAGRIRPLLEQVPSLHRGATSPLTVARWRTVPGPDVDAALDALAAAAPPIALPVDLPPPGADLPGLSGVVESPLPLAPSRRYATDAVHAAFVDGLARHRLGSTGWKPPLQGLRGPDAQALRGVFSVLSNKEKSVKPGAESFQQAVAVLGHDLEREARRAAGEPAVSARLRLVLPEDAEAAWPLTLELVDESGAWCTAGDVVARTPLAVDVAGGVEHLDVLDAVMNRNALALAAEIPVLGPLARPGTDGRALLELEEVAELLETAPAVLSRLGIDLIGPEALVRATPGVRGAARPPGGERRGGLTAAALVDWSVAVTADDGSVAGSVSDEEIARASAAGIALLQVGGRWVQLDGSQLARARKAVEGHRDAHGEVDALTLLRLAAEGGDEVDTVLQTDGLQTDGRGDGDPLAALDAAAGDAPALWLGDLLAGLPDESLVETMEPPGFVGELRHYQRRGLSWLQFLARVGLGGVLADDMGLGKTATALAHLLGRPGPHLVVCPLSVVRNWQNEAARFAPSLRVVVHHGADRQRGEEASDLLADADIVVTTYGLLARDTPELAEVPWSTMILDEAQMVKNPATRAARAVRHITAGQKIALTGTPVENHLGELWAILDAVNPGMLGSNRRFRDRYARPIERDGDEAVAERLRTLTQPFVLRRTKADKRLLPDLPEKIEQIAWATLTKEQVALYEKVVEQLLADAAREEGMKRRGLVLAALTRLKQICNHPAHVLGDGSRLGGRSGKLNRFDELVDELLEAEERALVFTQFRQMGELLQRHLAERNGIAAPFLHGGVPRARRDAMVEAFQAGQGAPLLLVSLKAGGTGLNLTAATRVIHYDRWWNPAVEDQASDRAWRIGQTETVFVHKLVCSGTVEEKISALIDDKKRLAESVIGTGEAWLSELSTDELRDLVHLDLEQP